MSSAYSIRADTHTTRTKLRKSFRRLITCFASRRHSNQASIKIILRWSRLEKGRVWTWWSTSAADSSRLSYIGVYVCGVYVCGVSVCRHGSMCLCIRQCLHHLHGCIICTGESLCLSAWVHHLHGCITLSICLFVALFLCVSEREEEQVRTRMQETGKERGLDTKSRKEVVDMKCSPYISSPFSRLCDIHAFVSRNKCNKLCNIRTAFTSSGSSVLRRWTRVRMSAAFASLKNLLQSSLEDARLRKVLMHECLVCLQCVYRMLVFHV